MWARLLQHCHNSAAATGHLLAGAAPSAAIQKKLAFNFKLASRWKEVILAGELLCLLLCGEMEVLSLLDICLFRDISTFSFGLDVVQRRYLKTIVKK